jgi:hypothetical protein
LLPPCPIVLCVFLSSEVRNSVINCISRIFRWRLAFLTHNICYCIRLLWMCSERGWENVKFMRDCGAT